MKNLRTQPSEGTFPVVQNLTNPTLSRVFLMTYEKGVFAQAEPGIASGSTIERKKMSTKTIYKRIALVAVTALGAGVLSVAPASATVTAGTSFIHAGTGATTAANFATSVSVAVGTRATVDLTSGFTAGTTDAVTLTAVLTSSPANAAGVAPNAIGAAGGATFTTVGTVTNGAASGANDVRTITATGAGAVTTVQTLGYTPTVPGIYVITTTVGGAAGTVLANGSLTHVLTINAGFSADSLRANRVFPIQGSNTTTGWAATSGGLATVRVTGLATGTRYYATVTDGVVNGVAVTASIAGGVATGGTASTYNLTNGSNLTGGIDFWSTSATRASNPSDGVDISVTNPTGAATSTVTVRSFDALTGAASTFAVATVTWGVAAAASAQYSLLTLNAGAGTTATGSAADTAATTVARTAGTKQFTIQAVVKDQYDVAINGLTLLASISGPGSLGIATTTASSAALAGRSLSVALTGTNLGHVTVFGDGTSGVATVTISVTNALGVTTVLGTKSVTFVGSPATATVTQVLRVAQSGTRLGLVPSTSRVSATSAATAPAFRASVVDSNGVNVVAGSTVRMVSSDETVIVPGTCAEYSVDGDTVTAGGQPTPGIFECSVSGANAAVSGKTATITFSVLNTATGLYSIVAAPITFAIGGAIASTVVAVNKTSYLPGEAIVMTATAKDSAGNAAYDGQNPYASTATANMSVGGAFPAHTTAFIVGGVHSTTSATGVHSLFAPASTGTLTVSGLTAATTAAPAGAAYTATVTIANAPSAELTAITTLVNSLIAKINALNKLVIKIQKKVRA
jgi:trimeric autotransporter adhesin